MLEEKRPLKVFLCHARADKQKVRELYRYLLRRRIKPWFDEMDLVGGQDWQVEIPKALATSDAIIICLTKNSVDKEGYIQKEIKFALDKALEMPEGRIFLIPVRFEECEVPFSLSRYQWVDLFDEAGYARMMRALKFRASQLQRADVEMPGQPQPPKPEGEAAEKAAREKAAGEKLEREDAEKAMREKAKRDAAEKAKHEKAERQAAQIAVLKGALTKFFTALKSTLPKAILFLRIIGIVGSIIILFWFVSWTIPKFSSLLPIAKASATISPTATVAFTNSPVPATKTPKSSATPTRTQTPVPTALPSEVTDAKGVQMVLVPAGEFTMGSNADNALKECEKLQNGCKRDWFLDEQPEHLVYLSAYYVDKYEVTNMLYKVCARAEECLQPSNVNKYNNPQYSEHPVVYVDWYKAKVYCEWRGARLPTEVEWEKAARGTDRRTYPWGEGVSCDFANYTGCVGDTTKVGSHPMGKSPYGIYDLSGNVSELVADWYDVYPGGDPKASRDFGQSFRVMRGGPWKYAERLLRVSQRLRVSPDYGDDLIGFRCARDANP